MGNSLIFISAKAGVSAESMSGTAVERVFRHDGMVVAASLCLLTLLAWLFLLVGAGTGMDPVAMSGWLMPLQQPPAFGSEWTALYWLAAFCMWVVMMVAMMLPSASPIVLLYARVVRHAESQGRASRAASSIAAFASAYFSLWVLFSLLAVVAQWALERLGAMSAMMSLRATALSGAVLIAAGLYQLTPFKTACLRHCREPAQFIAAHWCPGLRGAWRMGFSHGVYCLGCCTALMLLLFVGGVMNLVWITGLTLLVAIEKLAPFGAAPAKAIAVLLIAAGVTLITAAL
jgi:predicted metal-binding membrane protein